MPARHEGQPMKTLCVCLVFALAAAPVAAADEPSSSTTSHRTMFWSGLALAVAGVATSVVGITVARVDDTSPGNAPNGTYQACVAQKAKSDLRDKRLQCAQGQESSAALERRGDRRDRRGSDHRQHAHQRGDFS